MKGPVKPGLPQPVHVEPEGSLDPGARGPRTNVLSGPNDRRARPLLGLVRGVRLDPSALPGVRGRVVASRAPAAPEGRRRADGHRDRRGLQRGVGDRAADREPARARLSGRQVEHRRQLRRVVGSNRGDRPRVSRRAGDLESARGQGCRAGPRGAADRRRDRRVLRRELHLVARRAAHARTRVRRSRCRLRVRSVAHPRCGGWQQGGRLLELRDEAACSRVTARLGHRRQRLDLRGASRRLRRGRPTLRPRSLAPVPDGAARAPRRLRARAPTPGRSRRRRTRPSTGARCACSSIAG